jgi:uncharacterized protein (DUF1810 family)
MKRGVDDRYNLQRFVDAQDGIYDTALAELRDGSKRCHWMWFIFPQLAGLGRSTTTHFYGITSLDEAHAYLGHPLLGNRLAECAEAILPWAGRRSAEQIFGPVDAMKLRSSLTLFDLGEPNSIFAETLDAFFRGERDERTLALLNA